MYPKIIKKLSIKVKNSDSEKMKLEDSKRVDQLPAILGVGQIVSRQFPEHENQNDNYSDVTEKHSERFAYNN